jgi:hypothetical protein
MENTSVIELAQHIRERPSMYFGSEITLSNLENLLHGFAFNSQKESVVPFQYFNLLFGEWEKIPRLPDGYFKFKQHE